jgi:hypothetical protein
MNKRRRHTAKRRARAQKRIVAETQRRLRNLVPVPRERGGSGMKFYSYSQVIDFMKALIGPRR